MPIELPAPGRFSMTIGWPTCRDTSSNTMRAITSVALPGASGTTTLIGLEEPVVGLCDDRIRQPDNNSESQQKPTRRPLPEIILFVMSV
jgi:hypothetical protein